MNGVLTQTGRAPKPFEAVAPHDPAARSVGIDAAGITRKPRMRAHVGASGIGEKQQRTLEPAVIDPESARSVWIHLDELLAAIDDLDAIKTHPRHVGPRVRR